MTPPVAKFASGLTVLALIAAMPSCSSKPNASPTPADVEHDRQLSCAYTHVMGRMNDPDSFRIVGNVATVTNDKGNIIDIFRFRAKNGFGAIVTSLAGCEWSRGADGAVTLVNVEINS